MVHAELESSSAPLPDKPRGKADPVLLSLFANRFMSIAEAMGRALQQTSISTNIKERLDFSTAIFAPNGDLVANAPHLPVHLGSMSFAVRYQINLLKDDLNEGDVILTNHPVAGGSHLPDITCITPVFEDGRIVFFTASRGHHADIGGIASGSMPPTSKTIYDEGAQIKSFKVISKGIYQRDELHRLMVEEPAKFPGSVGSRCWSDVESDLKAQIAANNKGVSLINLLNSEYGLETVQEYMLHIRDNAELAVRNLLKKVAERQGTTELHALDHLDDGTPIELHVTIDKEKGSAVFDFEGTGPEIYGNLNAPVSVTYSAIIYCLRAMVDQDIPLNQGCLVPIEVKLPTGCCLDPSDTAAVVGGNVCTSQRVTDVVLRAFKAASASQGCCNNLTFGNSSYGYYETVAGGSGAGATWEGTSGVHCHMTNTRITDPEILERRYPTILHQFSLRKGSGGKGQHNGGDGVIRRRTYRPYGMYGGEAGECGRNLWIKRLRKDDGDLPNGDSEKAARPADATRVINLGGKATVMMGKGDRFKMYTPGGGGWGREGDEKQVGEKGKHERHHPRGSVYERSQAQEGV
ncbi:hypothetical protein Rhopal_000916-T1 [Rhodotorula paludigena]|uniref:Hydantoinase B/oxoprolinase domain-containing protein n=1 Tax=Rhodotorula paludigena TaxID=86838 RepID=A0AAV5G5X8_9BASI|nr:hypothetical protein Rhopal_000916-T1 [Rhodotorula paludigena]